MKLQKIMPSKKFLKFFGGILGLILLIVLIGAVANKKAIYKQNANSKGQVLVVGDATEKDSDNDGLKDWEEFLWGTDPYNPDTDGNGVGDSEQIKKIQTAISGINLGENSLATDTTKTGALTRDILTIAKAVSQAGPLTAESQEAVTNEIVRYLEARSESKYTIKDITLLEDVSQKQRLAYLTTIKYSLEKELLRSEDIELIANYEKNLSYENTLPYAKVGEKFKNETAIMQKTKVPEQFISEHLDYINQLNKMAELYLDLSQQDTDPVRSLSALLAAEKTVTEYVNFIEFARK